VLAGMERLRRLRELPDDPPPRFRVRRAAARRVVEAALAEGRDTLHGDELAEILAAYGVPVVPSAVVASREEALRAARRVGFPLVMKVHSDRVLHKSDRGGVLVDLRNREEVLDAYDRLEERFIEEDPAMRVLVQAMRSEGVETFIGVASDPLLGRMLAFGLGGIHVEILKDVVFRMHPLTASGAREMVGAVRGRALFEGARGKPPVDEEQLAEVLLRISQLVTDVPELAELDLNPFLAGYRGAGSCALDMRARVAPGGGC